LGQPTYLAAKAKGDNRLLVKRWLSENVYGRVPQDPRDKAKATLPESQFPAMQAHIHRHHVQWRCHELTADYVVAAGPSDLWATASEAVQGNERGAYVAL
jgi:hypothetical protein